MAIHFFRPLPQISLKMSDLSKLQAGDQHYKAFVGPPLKYDMLGALQFSLLTSAGLRAHHRLCDIGCGSLRAGKLLLPYLDKGHYFGMEPEQWLIDEGIKEELGADLIRLKSPSFSNSPDFEISLWNQSFHYIIAQSIFSHAGPEMIQTCFREVGQCLASDGFFLATFIWGAADYTQNEWVYPGCVSYRAETIAKWAKEEGLQMTTTNWPHPNGQSWVLLHHPNHYAAAKKVARYNLDLYQADVIAIPEESSSSLRSKLKGKLKSLLK